MMASSSPARVDDSQRASSADTYHELKSSHSRALLRPPEQSAGLNCPRCDSPNTKFCYYNNYSLKQPRYFCKTCRRYWTKGGALRNVPVGGGCRKNKRKSTTNKLPTSTSYSRRLLDNNVVGTNAPIMNISTSTSIAAVESGSLNCPRGLSISPVVDYSFPRLKQYYSAANSGNKLLSSYGSGFSFPAAAAIHSESSGATAAGSLTGFKHPIPPVGMLGQNIIGASSSSFSHSTASLFNNDAFNSDGHAHLGSSIECLSSMNQDLHWKLQQHSLGLLFGGNIIDHKETTARFNAISAPVIESQQQQTIVSGSEVCVNGNGSSKDCANGVTIQPYFDSFCATDNNNNNSHAKSTDNDTDGGNWNGFQAWNALHQLGVMP